MANELSNILHFVLVRNGLVHTHAHTHTYTHTLYMRHYFQGTPLLVRLSVRSTYQEHRYINYTRENRIRISIGVLYTLRYT